MEKEKKEINNEITDTEKRSVLTTFILLFPAMLIVILTTREVSLFNCIFATVLFCFQAILLRNFIKDHYSLS